MVRRKGKLSKGTKERVEVKFIASHFPPRDADNDREQAVGLSTEHHQHDRDEPEGQSTAGLDMDTSRAIQLCWSLFTQCPSYYGGSYAS
jgi:hypothetical protein